MDRANGSATADTPSGSELFEPTASRIGFGCAGIMQSASGRHRQRLLAEAFEQGIRHFDVARMYGLGAAERELGQLARGRREEITIATKFGIEPGGAAGRLGRLQAPARAVVARFPALRQALKRHADTFHQPHRYDQATARTSLQTSLRELDTEYVDILFIHGPAPADELAMPELEETLEELRQAGLLRAWGLAGEADPCIALSRAVERPVRLQIRDDILDPTLPLLDPGQPAITFGVLSRALRSILSHVYGRAERRSSWNRAVGEDCGRPEVVASLLLQDALARNPAGTVLFSTTRPERVSVATVAAESLSREPDPGPLRAFRELVSRELTPKVPVHG
ncbi:MAG: aldo/keto reductase [Solirubrobacteraceae bacterium]